jgi:hypothetical protein
MIFPDNIVDFLIDDNHEDVFRCVNEVASCHLDDLDKYSIHNQIVSFVNNKQFVEKLNKLNNADIMKLITHMDDNIVILLVNYMDEYTCNSIVSSNIISKYSENIYTSNMFCIMLFKASCNIDFCLYKQYDFLKSYVNITTIIGNLKTIYKILLTENTIMKLFHKNIFVGYQDIITKIDNIYRKNRNELTLSRLKTLIDNLLGIYRKNVRYYKEQYLFNTNLDLIEINIENVQKKHKTNNIVTNFSDLYI